MYFINLQQLLRSIIYHRGSEITGMWYHYICVIVFMLVEVINILIQQTLVHIVPSMAAVFFVIVFYLLSNSCLYLMYSVVKTGVKIPAVFTSAVVTYFLED